MGNNQNPRVIFNCDYCGNQSSERPYHLKEDEMKWTREKFKEEFGEDPVDMFGEDWENYIEDFVESYNDEIYAMKFGKA